jgi:hypothetical protein
VSERLQLAVLLIFNMETSTSEKNQILLLIGLPQLSVYHLYTQSSQNESFIAFGV